MQFSLLSEKKLRMILDDTELYALDIDPGNLDKNDPKMKQAVNRLLAIARLEYGFDYTPDCNILVEITPLKEGKCLFLFDLQKGRQEKNAGAKKMKASYCLVLRDQHLEPLTSACVALNQMFTAKGWQEEPKKIQSFLFRCPQGYQLVLACTADKKMQVEQVLMEFGQAKTHNIKLLNGLCETCTQLSEDAIASLCLLK